MNASFLIIGISSLLITGCVVGPDYTGAKTPPLGGHWIEAGTEEFESVSSNFSFFAGWNEPQLENLLALAAAENRELERARANLSEATARRVIVRSALFPNVSLNESYTRQQVSETSGIAAAFPPGAFDRIQSQYNSGLNASWEIDLFGYNRNRSKASMAMIEASAAELHALRLSIEAETALAYIEWAAVSETLTAARERRDLQQRILQLIRRRIETGLSDSNAVDAAQRDLNLANAEVQQLENAVIQIRLRLGVLTGQTPESFIAQNHYPTALPGSAVILLPPSIPAQVVRARPDVRAAERVLAAAYAELGAAEADFYPRLRINGAIGWESSSSEDMFETTSRTWLIQPSVHFPLFQGGRLHAQQHAAQARLDAAQAGYEGAVLSALADVESALAGVLSSRKRESSFASALTSARAAESRTARLHELGLADLETLLAVQRLTSLVQTQFIRSRADAFSHAIHYFKAIGGESN